MIPNAGLDNVAAHNLFPRWSGSDASSVGWAAYAAISEDSSAPDAGDTGIGAEKMRTNSLGGFTRVAIGIRDPGTNRVGMSVEQAYVFNIVTNLNITKYGYVPLSSGGNFSWIDLTRTDPDDPGSTPVVLTLVNGDQLQFFRTLTVTMPWSVDLESFVITGTAGNDTAGTHECFCGFYATGDDVVGGTNNIVGLVRDTYGPTGLVPVYIMAAACDATRDAAIGSSSGGATASPLTAEAYTSATYYRDKTILLTTSQGNWAITGLNIQAGQLAVGGYGFKIVFDDPATFVKDNSHTLSLTFRVSWAEA